MDTATVMDIAIESLIYYPSRGTDPSCGVTFRFTCWCYSSRHIDSGNDPEFYSQAGGDDGGCRHFRWWQLAIMMEYFQTIFERVRVLNG